MLAARFGENEEAAYLAGLSHDMCKEMSIEDQERLITIYHDCIDFLADRPALHALSFNDVLEEKCCMGLQLHAIMP